MTAMTAKSSKSKYSALVIVSIALVASGMLPAVDMTRELALSRMAPYSGDHVPGVDTSTLTGKVMCGYQGWFAAEGDGAGRGFAHYAASKPNEFIPGRCTIEYWPDMSDFDEDESYPTAFMHGDGSPATVFSSYNQKTVIRHFAWMAEHGIDGVFLQRFASMTKQPLSFAYRNQVTANVQAGANLHGRTWALMYDITGMKLGDIESVLIPDFKELINRMHLRKDASYLHHEGKPVIAVWGVGFKQRLDKAREYTLEECERLIQFLKSDPVYGGNCVMLGVPSFWREQVRDSTEDERYHAILKQADIISPWPVGRYKTIPTAIEHAEQVIAPDIAWCKNAGLDLLPVAYPGFSWHNLRHSQGRFDEAKFNNVPRLKGEFFWTQIQAHRQAGANMLYVAMFDEIDEGTAIFKCSNNPPVGDSQFLDYEGLPTDHYLWLTGLAGQVMRGELAPTAAPPAR